MYPVSGVRCLVSDVTIEVLHMYDERNHILGPPLDSGYLIKLGLMSLLRSYVSMLRATMCVRCPVSGVWCLMSLLRSYVCMLASTDVTIEVLRMYAERNQILGPTLDSGWCNHI
jgi:hypothetical protein